MYAVTHVIVYFVLHMYTYIQVQNISIRSFVHGYNLHELFSLLCSHPTRA